MVLCRLFHRLQGCRDEVTIAYLTFRLCDDKLLIELSDTKDVASLSAKFFFAVINVSTLSEFMLIEVWFMSTSATSLSEKKIIQN